MPLSFEERDHRALPPSDYGYGVFTATTTVTMNLKDPNGPWQSTRPTVAVRGTIDATAAVSMLKTAISESVTEAANEVMRRAWQEPNACAQLHVSADQTTAPRGGQIKLTFSATAHDGSPLSTPLTITTSCPGKLSDTHPSTDGSGIATVTLTDPNSQWHDSTGACVHATMQTRAGRGETDRTIPAQPSNRDRVTGTLSISVTYHDTCDTGQGLNETDNWSGTGNIDESTDPVNTDPDTRFTHNSMLTFGGTWSSGGCSDPYTGQTSGTDSGSSQASVTGQDGISDSNGGVSAYFDTPSQGQLTLYLDWPVDGTDNCQDLGASHVTGDLGTEIVLPIPTSGGGTVNVDKVLTYGSGDNQWTNGWGPSCSGTPPDPGTNVHITGSLNVQRAG
jgi:hypothetical protein